MRKGADLWGRFVETGEGIGEASSDTCNVDGQDGILGGKVLVSIKCYLHIKS